MKECWVDVYEYHNDIIYGQDFNNVKEAFESGQNIKSVKYLYRLHIKVGAKSSRIFYPYMWKFVIIKIKKNFLKVCLTVRSECSNV